MRILRVGLGVSALAVAIIVVYGYLFGMQSARALIAPSGGLFDFYYFAIIATAAGALAAILIVRGGPSARSALEASTGYGLAYGAYIGVVTGGLLVVWQMLFTVIVNILMGQPGLFSISSTSPYPANPQLVFVGVVVDLYLTFTYSVFEGFLAIIGGMLAGSITGFLYRRYARTAPRGLGRPVDTA
ncbi:MAG TPA: hypothetical protein VGF38_09670 [Ktedonobacterales bacterium]|jgi:hypothetical protein